MESLDTTCTDIKDYFECMESLTEAEHHRLMDLYADDDWVPDASYFGKLYCYQNLTYVLVRKNDINCIIFID